MQEKRKHARTPVDLAVSFDVSGGPAASGRCVDLSLGGAFITTSAPAAFGATVRLSLAVSTDETIVIDATVRWQKSDGMGVQFGLMGARETHALVNLLGA